MDDFGLHELGEFVVFAQEMASHCHCLEIKIVSTTVCWKKDVIMLRIERKETFLLFKETIGQGLKALCAKLSEKWALEQITFISIKPILCK